MCSIYFHLLLLSASVGIIVGVLVGKLAKSGCNGAARA
jgi:hypothetical protein